MLGRKEVWGHRKVIGRKKWGHRKGEVKNLKFSSVWKDEKGVGSGGRGRE